MKNAKLFIEEVIKSYSEGKPPINIEDLKEEELKRENLIALGYDPVGDPEEHEILEKYYPETRKKGINFKIYLFRGEIWSSGIDFIHYTLQEVMKKIKSARNTRLFLDSKQEDGAIIIDDHMVCRFSLAKEIPMALTLETDISIIDSMKGGNFSTNAAIKTFEEINPSDLNSLKIQPLRQILAKTK